MQGYYRLITSVLICIVWRGMFRSVETYMLYPVEDIPGSGGMVIFKYFVSKLSWNDARAHCQSIGGDLAKIPTQAIHNTIINMAFENFGENIFAADYWTGLVHQLPMEYRWVSDCSPIRSEYLTNFELPFHKDESCFKIKKADHWGDRKPCSEKHGFMCQMVTTAPCPFTQRLSAADWLWYNGSDCLNECTLKDNCWGVLQRSGVSSPDDCLLIGLTNTGIESVQINSKFCYNITRDLSTIPEAGDNAKIPNNECLMGTVSTVSIPAFSTSTYYVTPTPSSIFIAPTSIICPTVTKNITIPLNVTQNVTLYETVFINLTETAFHSEYITESNYFHHHHTHNVTVTITSVQVRNVTVEEVEAIAEEYVKNLTIDTKETSSYIRSKTSAEDKRESAKYMGFIGTLFVAVPMTLMIILDVKKVMGDIRNYAGIYRS